MTAPRIWSFDALPSVDLTTVVQTAALQERHDRKYLIPQETLHLLGAAVVESPAGTAVLADAERRWFRYRSEYFDSSTLACYRMAAQRRHQRYKVRTRSYLDSQDHFLEVKVRDRRGRTVKTRTAWSPDPDWRRPLAADGVRFVEEVLGGPVGLAGHFPSRLPGRFPGQPPGQLRAQLPGQLRGQLRTDYVRLTLLLPGEVARATVDLDLIATDATGDRLPYTGLAIVETKTSGRPCTVDRLLWALGHRPIRVSKYATSLARLRPGLPANRWQPALRRLPAPRPVPLAGAA